MNKKVRKIVLAVLALAVVIGLVWGFAGKKEGSEDKNKVFVEIQCDQLLGDGQEYVDENTRNYIPEDGVVLNSTEVAVPEGASAYDALEKICKDKDIQLDTEDSAYGVYIKGISYLYEVSTENTYGGWMYQVNGEEPQVAASEYEIQPGDTIVFYYSIMNF